MLASIGPKNKQTSVFPASLYTEGFRDDNLKVNDDRKVKMTLSDYEKDGTMILLTVRMHDVKKNAANFNEAWFRLQNEDTNQTIDYSYVEKVLKQNGIEETEEDV